MVNNTGSIIAELRKEAGYTQKTLANALNITDKAVSKWERGLSQPDVTLLPKLSLLLDADIELLVGAKVQKDEWIGLLDLQDASIDLSENVYDKPLVYYFLVHFLLLGITDIYVNTSKDNERFLSLPLFETLGFTFTFDFLQLPECNVMILNRPWFIFGSDLTRQFQGAMATGSIIKLVPYQQASTFLFCPASEAFMYLKNPEYLESIASAKTLGRGMISIEMIDIDKICDVANFVRVYQENSNLLIGCLEEVAYNKNLISRIQFEDLIAGTKYNKSLLNGIHAK